MSRTDYTRQPCSSEHNQENVQPEKAELDKEKLFLWYQKSLCYNNLLHGFYVPLCPVQNSNFVCQSTVFILNSRAVYILFVVVVVCLFFLFPKSQLKQHFERQDKVTKIKLRKL